MPRQAAVKNAALWSVGNAVAGQGLSLIVFFITSKFVEPAAFGLVATAILIIELVKRVLIDPFSIKLNAMREPNQSDYNLCFTSIIVTTAIGGIILFLSAVVAQYVLRDSTFGFVLLAMGVLIISLGLSRTYEVYYAKQFDFKTLAVRSIVSAMLGGAAGVSLALSGFGVWSLVIQQLVAGAASLALLWYGAQWKPTLSLKLESLRSEVAAVKDLAFSNVLGLPLSDSDLMIVTALNGATAGGVYSAAKRIVLAANMIASYSTQNLTLSYFSHIESGAESKSKLPQALAVVAPLFVLVFSGLSIVSSASVAVLLGAKWRASAFVLSWLALTAMFQALSNFLYGFMIVERAAHVRTKIMAAGAAAMILVLCCAAEWGYAAVAMSSVAVSGAIYLVSLLACCRIANCDLTDIVALQLKIGLCTLIMVIVGVQLERALSPILSLILLPSILAAIYFLAMKYLIPQSFAQLIGGLIKGDVTSN